MYQLMMANGITFAWRGKVMASCNFTKMENCTLTPRIYKKNPFKEEAPWCWGKNKTPLEEASNPASPSKAPWPMSTCGLTSFRHMRSSFCPSLACQGRGTCTSGLTSSMASKETPNLSFLLLVFRPVLKDDYSAIPDTLCSNLSKKNMASLSETIIVKRKIATVKA